MSIDILNLYAPLKKKYLRANHSKFISKELSKDIMLRSKLRNKFMVFMAWCISSQLCMRKQPPPQKVQAFLKLITFSISTTVDIYSKLLTLSKSSVKRKVKSASTFFVILLTSAVICKQRLLLGNEIVLYFQNYKYFDDEREIFRRRL